MSHLQVFESLAQCLELGIVQVLTEAAGDFYLYFLSLCCWIGCAQDRFQQIGIEDQGLQVVLNAFDHHVFVYQRDSLSTQSMPQ